MTGTFSPQKSHDEAAADVGTIEQPPHSNCQGYSEWQYGVHCPPGGWCCSATSKWAYDAGFRWGDTSHGDKGPSHTDELIAWAVRHGLFRDPRTYRAKRGDLAVFNWDSSATTGTDHVEQIDFDDGWRMTLIGGNTSDAVAWRVRDKSDCVAIIALTASDQAKPPFDAAAFRKYLESLKAWEKRVAAKPLVLRDRGDDVETLNRLMHARGLMGEPADWRHYGGGTRQGVWNLKHIEKLPDRDGKRCGGTAAHALLNP